MFARRNFLQKIGGICACCLLPKSKSQTVQMPFLPTLEFLQEHNKDVTVFLADYSTRQTSWHGLVHRICKSKEWKDHRAKLFWENGKWFAVEDFYRDENGVLYYEKKIPWPDWLRKF